MAKYIIAQNHGSIEGQYYVSQIPNIQFMEKREDAVEMDQKTVIETMNQLATMQRCSSFSYRLCAVKPHYPSFRSGI